MAITLREIKQRIDEAEGEYSAARKDSREHSQVGTKLVAALEEAIHEITVFLERSKFGLVKDPNAEARNRKSLEEYRQVATLRLEELKAELGRETVETTK